MDTATPQPAPVPIVDATKYIRTYAKDVAALTGKNPTLPKSKSKKSAPQRKPSPAPAPKLAELPVSQEISKEPADLSVLKKQAELNDTAAVEQNPFTAGASTNEEPLDLPTIGSGMIIKAAAPPKAIAHNQEPALSPATESASDVGRQDILARLRANVTAPKPYPLPTPIPSPAPVSPQSMPPAIPPAPVVPLPQPSSLTTVNRIAAPMQAEAASAPIHTYKTDFADEVDRKGANTFSVLAAENDARPQRVVSQKRNIWPAVILGIVLLIVGICAAGAGYYVLESRAPVSLLPAPASLIVPDSRISLTATNETLLSAFAALTNNPIPANSVEQVILPSASSTTNDITTTDNALSILSIPAPDILIRNTDPSSMAGIVNDGSQTSPFFILRVTSYERTFAGMLQWETTMPNDLGALYPSYPAPAQDASSTATTSVSSAAQAGFTDEVVASHNARAYKDSYGNTVLIYGYADSQTLIIARDESAFALLLQRLEASNQ